NALSETGFIERSRDDLAVRETGKSAVRSCPNSALMVFEKDGGYAVREALAQPIRNPLLLLSARDALVGGDPNITILIFAYGFENIGGCSKPEVHGADVAFRADSAQPSTRSGADYAMLILQ